MKQFTMRNESFTCEHCGKIVPKSNYTARDHCPYCLYSKHVDINPGDRMHTCKGLFKPIGIEKFKNTYKIIYQCEKCHQLHKNVAENYDSIERIIELSIVNEKIY